MYSPIQVANRFIELALAKDAPITQMQAQKLTYIAHGVSLGHVDKPLLTDPICAWRYGPVIPALYSRLRNSGKAPILQRVPVPPCAGLPFTPFDEMLINNVYEVYGKYPAETLSNFTHRSGTPWSVTMEKNETIIPDELINKYYKGLIKRDPLCIGL